jgi:hypothetical protein
MSDSDIVNHPKHYTQGNIECIDAIESAVSTLSGIDAVCTANVIKYVWRWKHKNGSQDLRKAQFYLNKLIDLQEAQNGN